MTKPSSRLDSTFIYNSQCKRCQQQLKNMKTVVAATVMMTGALSETALVGQVSRVRSLIITDSISLYF